LVWAAQKAPFSPTPSSGTRLIDFILHNNTFSLGTAASQNSIGFRTDSQQTFFNYGTTFTGYATGNSAP
jgi:hypothetical protein